MDIWQKIFLYLGSGLAAVIMIAALFALGTSENGQLTVDGMAHLADQMTALYEFIRWFVYLWLVAGIVLLVRFLMRVFGRR
ncbi:MAG: hypothetical protein ACP5D0_02725 [Hydrogenovibrio sp.]